MASRNPLAGRTIALGVTASIAAYKAVALASSLTQEGALVDVVMTPEATQLVRPLTFEAITHRFVAAEMFQLRPDGQIAHVAIARSADLYVVAPATAHTIAKLALGLADDLVCATALATAAPAVLAPAMESAMWLHPATQGHLATLRQWGWTVIGPEMGHLASGAVGEGRMAQPERIVDMLKGVVGAGGDLAGWRVTVTAGGTREAIDPVRFVSNRSSGKMGHAVAAAARDRGADVTLVSSAALPGPEGVRLVPVERAEEMLDAVLQAVEDADLLVMAAAVADYQPAEVAPDKLKKSGRLRELELIPTVDILGAVGEWARRVAGSESRVSGSRLQVTGPTPSQLGTRNSLPRPPILVGFAAETENVVENARSKLLNKGLDLVVANDVTIPGSAFGSDFNQVTMLRPGKPDLELPLLPKIDVAHRLLDEVAELRRERQA